MQMFINKEMFANIILFMLQNIVSTEAFCVERVLPKSQQMNKSKNVFMKQQLNAQLNTSRVRRKQTFKRFMNNIDDDSVENENFVPKKPLELESLEPVPTLFGLEKKQDLDSTDPPIPLFTGLIVMFSSIYFMYSAIFSEDVLLDPTNPF
mmetsp:Transcript_22693/g.32019  ORF Transcript_22693/g.32019 Transcript_22693/m.32019 type:complete len:150 (-) Transcript_22693:386-835(-)